MISKENICTEEYREKKEVGSPSLRVTRLTEVEKRNNGTEATYKR